MSCLSIKKQADETLDRMVDFDDWLRPGDTIKSADVFADLPVTATPEGTAVRLGLTGGDAGTAYQIKLRVTTQQRRIKQVCIKLRIR